jgi:hypothetical protein
MFADKKRMTGKVPPGTAGQGCTATSVQKWTSLKIIN